MRILLFLLCALAFEAQAQYPAKPIALIVPFPPGGSTDIIGRIVADGLARALGQAVVVDNRGGAGGAVGAKAIADAAPDGYTLGVATVSTHVVNFIARGEALRYDPLRDFALISQIAVVPNVVSVHPGVPAQDMKEFLSYLKQNPGKLNYGTPGVGSLGHLIGETFKYAAKVDMVHVPYKGAGPALTDTLSGRVQVLFDNFPSSLPHIRAGKLRPLAVASSKRLEALPDVPTFAEVGLEMVNDPSWFGLVGPAGLSPERVSFLQSTLAAVLKRPEIAKRLEAEAATAVGNTPEQFREVVAAAIAKNRRVATEAKLKFD